MGKRLFEKGNVYKVVKKDSGYNDVEGEFVRILRNENGVRFAELKKGTRTWWIPETYWKYIEKVTK